MCSKVNAKSLPVEFMIACRSLIKNVLRPIKILLKKYVFVNRIEILVSHS